MKFADLRFTDTRGKEQHVTMPARLRRRGLLPRRQDVRRLLDRRLEGHQRVGHDPDARRRHRGHRSVLRGDHRQHPLRRHRADDHAGLRARPALARQARRGVPEVHRHRRRRALRPGERILHLRQRALGQRDARLPSTRSTRCRARGTPARTTRTATRATAPASRAATSRCRRSMPSRTSARAMCLALRGDGPEGRGAPPRGRHRRPVRDRHRRRHAGQEGRRGADPQVRRAQRRPRLRQDRDLHAQAPGRRQRQRHARAPVAAEGRQGAVRRRQVRRPVRDLRSTTSAASSSTRKRAQRLHQRRHQQLQAPGAGIRGAGDARLLGAQPLRLDPHPLGLEPEGAPHRGALPGLRPPTPTSPSPP